MPRVKRSVHARKKRRKVLEQAKGYWGLKIQDYTHAKEQVEHSLTYAYRDRKNRKRTLRRLWIIRINAAARQHGLSYNQFVAGLQEGGDRARPQGARRPRRQRSGRLRRASPSRRRPRWPSQSDLITSRDNEKLKLVRKLHERSWRDKLGLFVVRGRGSRRRGAAAGSSRSSCSSPARTSSRSCSPRSRRCAHPPRVIGVFRRADLPAGPQRPRGARALARRRPRQRRHADPHRGRVRRAFVALSDGCADPTSPESAARVGGRDLPRAALARSTSAAGRRVALVAARWRCRSPTSTSPGATTFVLGAEREGLPAEVLATCDERATIPIAGGTESLNVAVAGAIALYERSRRNQLLAAAARHPDRVLATGVRRPVEPAVAGFDLVSRPLEERLPLRR